MVSFIVIGKNEGWRLTKCLNSVRAVIVEDKIADYEIIYVDSKSTDDSLTRAQAFPEVNIFQITGECNAAIARNIGAKEAKGDILFFIDGDMEILSGFLPKVLVDNKLSYPFISGIFDDYIYDESWNFIEIQRRYNLTEEMPDRYENTTGGLFLIEKKLWMSVGGMDTRFKRSQDLDLGLRLSKKDIPLLRRPVMLALHHTIPYTYKKRKQIYFKSAKYTALLARKNILNKKYIALFFRSQYSAICLFLSFVLMALSVYFIALYILCLILRAYLKMKNSKSFFFDTSKIICGRDINFIIAFLFFYPQKYRVEYIKLANE